MGYHEERELEGIVPVEVSFASDLSNSGNLELLAQVKYSGDSIALRGISLHKLK